MTNKLIQKFAERFSFEETRLVDTLKATAFKVKDANVSDAQMMALLIVADQYGLNPFTREIYAFPDKQNGIVPVVGVDGWARIINAHPAFDGIAFQMAEQTTTPTGGKPCPDWLECVLYRRDRSHPVVIREYLDEVYREPFTGTKDNRPYTVNGPWQSHTKRMLRHKATIQAARLAFGFVGIYDPDEAERILEAQAESVITGNDDFAAVTGEPSAEAKAVTVKLIGRAQKAGGAWQAARDYAAEHFQGADLQYVNAEIAAAQQTAAQTLTQSANGIAEASTPSPGTAALQAARTTLTGANGAAGG